MHTCNGWTDWICVHGGLSTVTCGAHPSSLCLMTDSCPAGRAHLATPVTLHLSHLTVKSWLLVAFYFVV